MEENRDQILHDFQCCTGLEDVSECIVYLEATNWNLLEAINNVMPQETQTLPSEQQVPLLPERIPRRPSIEEVAIPDHSQRDYFSPVPGYNPHPITSPSLPPISPMVREPGGVGYFMEDEDVVPLTRNRLLNFNVKYKDKTIRFSISDTETIANLKTNLYRSCGIPPCRQELHGFYGSNITDETVLSSLHLSYVTSLQLSTPMEENDGENAATSTIEDEQSKIFGCLNIMFGLLINDQTKKKEYKLKFPGSKTVQEVKQDVYAVTNIPVRHQKWNGWPEKAKDENMTLAAIELNYPEHKLFLIDEASDLKGPRKPIVDITASESSSEEFEDAPECFSVDVSQREVQSSRSQPLMPENMNDEEAALNYFNQEFENRYGLCHPDFFRGTLAEALQSSCQKPAKERKPLIVYLHHDASVLTNVFCTQLLCSETIVTYLNFNFLTWAWDISFKSNENRFLASVTQHLGIAASSTIRNIQVDHLPALMVIGRVRATTEVITVVPGNVGLDELMTRLLHAVEVFNSGLATEIREEDERQAREQVKQEQDEAYQASLQADRLKEQAKQHEKQQREIEEEAFRAQREQEEKAKQQEEAVKKAIRLSLVQQLPPEPIEESNVPCTQIKIRLPSGKVLVRRFLAQDLLGLLLLFLASEGFPPEDYKVLASWPRRDLSALDPSQTFQELNLCPQEMVTLEER